MCSFPFLKLAATDSSIVAKLCSEGEKDLNPERVLFRDLPDPKNRFAALKTTQAYQHYEMCIPPVFAADGEIILPWKYEEIIPDGTLVAVRGKMKMSVRGAPALPLLLEH